ncbi:hypothetical protein BX616_006733 [Lobosporangium transversale]|nr:hypothetical protein BX616_006733 [Lobosporangium transversale]
MNGVDCDWCLLCERHTPEGEAYCSEECRSTDLMSSSATSSSSSSAGSAYFGSYDSKGSVPAITSPSSFPNNSSNDSYQMPPFVRKQRTSMPNIYAQCAANPNPPLSLMFSSGGNTASALSHHLMMQQQQKQAHNDSINQPTAATTYPLFYATLNALRPITSTGSQQ